MEGFIGNAPAQTMLLIGYNEGSDMILLVPQLQDVDKVDPGKFRFYIRIF